MSRPMSKCAKLLHPFKVNPPPILQIVNTFFNSKKGASSEKSNYIYFLLCSGLLGPFCEFQKQATDAALTQHTMTKLRFVGRADMVDPESPDFLFQIFKQPTHHETLIHEACLHLSVLIFHKG